MEKFICYKCNRYFKKKALARQHLKKRKMRQNIVMNYIYYKYVQEIY